MITVNDILKVFAGSKVVLKDKPLFCEDCGKNPYATIVPRAWADGRWDWCCHGCGREAVIGTERRAKKERQSNGFEWNESNEYDGWLLK